MNRYNIPWSTTAFLKEIKKRSIQPSRSCMKLLDLQQNILSLTKNHKIVIRYWFDGLCKRYIPDFFVKFGDKHQELYLYFYFGSVLE